MPTAIQKVLLFLAQNPHKEFYDSEIFRRLNNLSKASVNNALRILAERELTERVIRGRVAFNRIKEELPEIKHLKILANILRVKKIIEPIGDIIKKVVLFGSSSSGENRADSDLDIFIISDRPEMVRRKIIKDDSIQLIIKKSSEMIFFRKKNNVFYEEIQKGIIIMDVIYEKNI